MVPRNQRDHHSNAGICKRWGGRGQAKGRGLPAHLPIPPNQRTGWDFWVSPVWEPGKGNMTVWKGTCSHLGTVSPAWRVCLGMGSWKVFPVPRTKHGGEVSRITGDPCVPRPCPYPAPPAIVPCPSPAPSGPWPALPQHPRGHSLPFSWPGKRPGPLGAEAAPHCFPLCT